MAPLHLPGLVRMGGLLYIYIQGRLDWVRRAAREEGGGVEEGGGGGGEGCYRSHQLKVIALPLMAYF